MWTIIIFGIVALVVVSLVFFILVYSNSKKPTKFSQVLNPSDDIIANFKVQKKLEQEKEKKGKRQSFIKRKGLDKKIEHLYFKAGKNKTYEDFVKDEVKFIMIALILGVAVFFGVGLIFSRPIAILVAILVFLLYSVVPILLLFDSISKRRGEFLRDFPYFLLTYSFVLKGGTSTLKGFYDVVDKQSDGVLKEVLMKVKSKVKVESDILEAFKVIPTEIECLETKEFAETIRISIEKGLSIDETLALQSSTMEKMIVAKKKKSAKLLSAKIMIPIFFIMGAFFILFI